MRWPGGTQDRAARFLARSAESRAARHAAATLDRLIAASAPTIAPERADRLARAVMARLHDTGAPQIEAGILASFAAARLSDVEQAFTQAAQVRQTGPADAST